MPIQRHSASLKTARDIDAAIQRYRASNATGAELFRQWQAIRNASLGQVGPTSDYDCIPGDDSY